MYMRVILHICGASGSGKSTIGAKILKKHPRVRVKDLDDLHATHRWYIDVDADTLLRQRCKRLFTEIPNDEEAMRDLVENNERFLKLINESIRRDCSTAAVRRERERVRRQYADYEMLSPQTILRRISALLNKK